MSISSYIKKTLQIYKGSSLKQGCPLEFSNYFENHPGVWNILNNSQQRTSRKSK
jgi:hypothetical protein